jgi:hypothetical protein
VVECDLAKVEVAGSTPVSRSKKFGSIVPSPAARVYAVRGLKDQFNRGAVPKW